MHFFHHPKSHTPLTRLSMGILLHLSCRHPTIPPTPWAAQGPGPSAASGALLGHVPKTSMWLPIAMPPLSPWLAFWLALPLKTQLLSSAYFSHQGYPQVLSARGAAKSLEEPGAALRNRDTEKCFLCLLPEEHIPSLHSSEQESPKKKTQPQQQN